MKVKKEFPVIKRAEYRVSPSGLIDGWEGVDEERHSRAKWLKAVIAEMKKYLVVDCDCPECNFIDNIIHELLRVAEKDEK